MHDRGRVRRDRGDGKYAADRVPSKLTGEGIYKGVRWGVRVVNDH